jgi:glycosyltransferase involved in cell wall biosynthesis
VKPVVVQLIDSFNQGGSERQALQLTRLILNSDQFDVRLASLSPEGILRTTISDLSLGEVPSFPLNSFYDQNAIQQLRRLVRWLKSIDAAVLHTHDFYTNVFGMAGGALARVPVRIASMRETAGMRSRGQHQAQQIAYSLAHHVVANSNAVREKLKQDGIRDDKITVVYNGLDLARLTSHAKRRDVLVSFNLPDDGEEPRPFVTIVANMRLEVKDYPMFLRAARKVKDAVPNAGFLLAGEGELADGLRSLARELNLEDSTFFLGRCERIADLLSISSVCVLSSKAEGFSNSILEYMAAGRPVVATDVGGAREAIVEGETGYLVPAGDDELMATRIITLLKEPNRAQSLGERGREVAASKFSLDTQLRQTEDLYNRLLQKRAE